MKQEERAESVAAAPRGLDRLGGHITSAAPGQAIVTGTAETAVRLAPWQSHGARSPVAMAPNFSCIQVYSRHNIEINSRNWGHVAMITYKSFLVLSTLLTCSTAAFAGECDAILKNGVRNTYKTLQSGSFNSTFKQKYCDAYSTAKSGSNSGSAGGSYGPFSANGSVSNQRMENMSKELCSDTNSALSDERDLEILEAIADKNIVDAWSACVSSRGGLFVNGELNGKTLVIEYRMRSAGAVNLATVEGNPTVINAKCDDAVKDGTVINTGGRFQTCTRESDDPITITVNTSFESKKFFIPAFNKEEVKKVEPAVAPPPQQCTLNCLLVENRADPRCHGAGGLSIIGTIPVKC
ncbi:hypothetical protein [Agrobacterium sp. LAD9]|uniref:hypothetical protein n=1 Tax=Agrobacterium sp. LAD9 TaxID=2055153 RepID=UPI00129057E0|nr:hypothetical protein [Agrobacterium sp. LAD9]